MAHRSGETAYRIYRALTYGLTPLIRLHLHWRKPLRWRERLGQPSASRPHGHLVWFHAVSLGEGLAVIPVIKCCLERRPDVTILMTTSTTSAFEVIKNRLPSNVIYQFAPLDIPAAVDAFLHFWRPNVVVLVESELWPNLVMGTAENGSTTQGIRFQLLQAPPSIINFSGDIKYVTEQVETSEGDDKNLEELQAQLSHRKVWMVSSIHKGEEERAHKVLKLKHPDIVTIVVPRQPQHGRDIALKLQKEGVSVALRSHRDKLNPGTNIFVIDSLGELRKFYRLTPIAVIGGSFLLGSKGHNILEAAAAGCAVLTGDHIGHFSHMVLQMQRVNPLSVLQISGEKLVEALGELFDNPKILEARRAAAKQAYCTLSSGTIESIWTSLQSNIFRKLVRDTPDKSMLTMEKKIAGSS